MHWAKSWAKNKNDNLYKTDTYKMLGILKKNCPKNCPNVILIITVI